MSDQKIDTNSPNSGLAAEKTTGCRKAKWTFYGSKLFIKIFYWFCLTTAISVFLAAIYGYSYHYKPAKEEFLTITTEIIQDNGRVMVEAYEKQGNTALERFKFPGNSWLFDENMCDLFENICDKNKSFKGREGKEQGGQENSCAVEEVELADCKKTEDSHLEQNASDITRLSGRHIVNLIKQRVRESYEGFYLENKGKIKAFGQELLKKPGTEVLNLCGENFIGCLLLSESGKKYAAVVHIAKRVPGHGGYHLLNHAMEALFIFVFVCAVLCFAIARYLAKPIIELKMASRKFAEGDFSVKITEQSKNRNDELGDLAIDFNDMAEKIESGINSQKRLFNDISHELRSPLARMQVSIELLQMKASESEKSLISRLEKDLNRMNALIGELLQFSRLENKEISSGTEEVDLGETLQSICNDAAFEGKSKNKNVVLTINQNSVIKGSPSLIERAFENVIRNALRFTAENSSVEVSIDKLDDKAVIQVADKGPGVPEKEMKKIFSPFYCVKEDRNPQLGGIGLGLSIALRAIQVHKGSITLSNRPEGGLVATVELPIALFATEGKP